MLILGDFFFWLFLSLRISPLMVSLKTFLGMNNIFYLVGICMGFPSNLSSCDSEQTPSKSSPFQSVRNKHLVLQQSLDENLIEDALL